MSLKNFTDFLNASAINEASTSDQLISIFTDFRKKLSSQREKEILSYASTSFATELGTTFTGLINNDNYMTVYDTVFKIRSGQGGKIMEFGKPSNKTLPEVLNYMVTSGDPTNKFEKAICLVLYMLDKNPTALVFAPKDSLAKETLSLNNINSKLMQLKKDHGQVRILVSDKFYQKSHANVVVVEKFDKVDGVPKADFKIVDIDSEPFIFISHKDGKSAKDFQQYGGISDSKILNHPEVVAFLEKMRAINTDFSLLPVGGREFSVMIKDPTLAAMSMFGADTAAGFGINNVHLVMQGDITLDPVKTDQGEGCYTLGASGHVILNPALTGNRLALSNSDPYWPTLFVSYRAGKGGTLGFKDARFGIWPAGSDPCIRGFKNMAKIDA
jgi:hypothetical protein